MSQSTQTQAAQEMTKLPDLKQLFFDCDNTLAQTESITVEVTAGVVNELLEAKGVTERYNGAKPFAHFFGMSFKKMMPELAKMYDFELTQEDIAHFAKREEDEVIGIIQRKGKPCVGSMEVLERLQEEAKYPMVVVSSSSTRRITATLTKTEQIRFFSADRIYSAQTSLEEPKGKPDPAIYLHVLKELGLKPEQCLTVEDSLVGAGAAAGADVPCIGYVGCYPMRVHQDQVMHDFLERGCVAVMRSWDEYDAILRKVTS